MNGFTASQSAGCDHLIVARSAARLDQLQRIVQRRSQKQKPLSSAKLGSGVKITELVNLAKGLAPASAQHHR
jgi:hypothetical protein